MSTLPAAPFSPLSPLLNSSMEMSDGMSSEGYSSANSDNFIRQRRKQHNLKNADAKNSAAIRAGQMNTPGRPLARKAEKTRPLCLDFLSGNCGRLRATCRYYHPEPGEVLPQQQQKSAGVCKVWVLTGFCKFGDKCWHKHPAPGPAAPATCIAEPLTKKFQGWMQSREPQKAAQYPAPEATSRSSHPAPAPTPAPEPMKLPSGHTLHTTIVLLERLTTNPEHTLQLLCQAAVDGTGLAFHELLPLVHAKALSELRAGPMLVRLALRLRPALAAEEHEAFDQQFYGILKESILSTLECGTASQMVRGVRNAKVLAEALLHGLVKPQQVTDILSLVSSQLAAQSAEHQDLRLLLLGHLLGDVFHSYGPAVEFSRQVLGFVPQTCVQSDTQAALERLQQVSANAPGSVKHGRNSANRGPPAPLSAAHCAPGTVLGSPLVHSPYSVSA